MTKKQEAKKALQDWEDQKKKEKEQRHKQNKEEEQQFYQQREAERTGKNPWERVNNNCEMNA